MKFQHIKIIVILLAFVSCEKDFASFDSEVINSDNAINFSTNSVEYNLTTQSEMVNPVQTNNLPSFLLGSIIILNMEDQIQVLLVKWYPLNITMTLGIMLY